MFSQLLRVLGRSLLFLCEPEKQLHRQKYLLKEEHQREVERLSGEHANFWRKWSQDLDYPLRLATSRTRILGKTCSIPELLTIYRKKFEEELEVLKKKFKLQKFVLELRQAELRHRRLVAEEGLRARL